ncbi:MAG TPA: hypothetical protein VFX59_11240, partial [Polyangiales bacterium]|nr:hypothetical protein [Polyangiales bacterium]
TNERGETLLSADGKPMVQASSLELSWPRIQRLSRLEIDYGPESSSARFTVAPSIVVHDSSEPFVKQTTLGSLQLYDRATSEAQIAQLTTQLGGGSSPALAERLVDVLPLLGSAVVATLKFDEHGREAAQVHGSVHLQDVTYAPAPALVLRSSTTADRQLVASAAAQVPVLEKLATQMVAGEICLVSWQVDHTPVQNVAFDVGAALEAAPLQQVRSLRNLLVAYPDSTVLVIGKMHVVESASFGVTPGHSIDRGDVAETSSVFTGTGAYSFGLADEAYVSLPSLVANVWYNKQTDRTSLLSLLDKLIRNKTLAVPNGGLGTLRDAVKAGFTPLELVDTTVTRDTLKQPRL